MNKHQEDKLEKILINVGDLCFKRRIIEIIKGLEISEKDIILDCGCGEGFYTMAINQIYPNVKIISLDKDAGMINKAKNWMRENGNIEWIVGDILDIPFKDNFFDKIILSEVLEHMNDDFLALEEVKRVLKTGGILCITVPNHHYPFFWDPMNWTREHIGLGHFNTSNGFFGGIWAMHLRLYYPEEIIKLVESTSLKIKKIKALTHYCFPFNHNILYSGKQFYTKFKAPGNLNTTMEKFEWKKANIEKNRFSFLRMILNIFKRIDSLNNRVIRLNQSSMCIFLLTEKIN